MARLLGRGLPGAGCRRTVAHMVMDELMQLERRGWDSLCDGMGSAFYGELMTENAVMVLAHGAVLNRAEVMASLDGAPPWRRYHISEERMLEIDARTIALVYTGMAWRQAPEPEFHALMSSVYTQQDGAWRLVLYQQTPIP